MSAPAITLDHLRRFAVARSLFAPVSLRRAINRMGFLQADPIRAPARAQDLILRPRVENYRAGELERRYVSLGVEEDFFINYGFVTREVQALMHPRPASPAAPAGQRKTEEMLLAFIAERGEVHPRAVDEHFAHGTVRNYWGGSSNATTHMLDGLHYRGLLRVARRVNGIRIYCIRRHDAAPLDAAARQARIDRLVDVAVNIYAPLPASSLSYYVRRLRHAAPQWQGEITGALRRARERLEHAKLEGIDWYWPQGENPRRATAPETVHLLAPFDPVVHDRTRFELFWDWEYRFEAYTPALKRKLGYYALPLLWRDRVIGWSNLAVKDGHLASEVGYVAGKPPRDREFDRELEAELERMRVFVGADVNAAGAATS